MRELPEGFSVVSDVEFEMLSHLPEFEPRGSGLVRVDDPEKFVIKQSEWNRHEEICRRVELECDALDAAFATDESQTLMERLLSAEVKPKVVAKVETTAPKHVETEEELGRRLFVDPPPPNHPENSGQHPNGPENPFATGFVRF